MPSSDLIGSSHPQIISFAQAYRQTRFHKVNTARILDISRKTLDRKLVQYGIGKEDA